MKNSDSWKEERKISAIFLIKILKYDGQKQKEAIKRLKANLNPNYNNNPT